MIKLCEKTKTLLKSAQVDALYVLLICHRRGLPAFVKKDRLHIETKQGVSLLLSNGVVGTPMAISKAHCKTVFEPVPHDFAWEDPLIVPIKSIMECVSDKITSYVAYNEEGRPINHFPLTGIQQLYEADPTRFC